MDVSACVLASEQLPFLWVRIERKSNVAYQLLMMTEFYLTWLQEISQQWMTDYDVLCFSFAIYHYIEDMNTIWQSGNTRERVQKIKTAGNFLLQKKIIDLVQNNQTQVPKISKLRQGKFPFLDR
jgi:succinate dehydrogenase hydrophobic anchor subunit